MVGDHLTGYSHSAIVRTGHSIYPGDKQCRPASPHGKWHEQSANALLDLVALMDDVDRLLRGGNLTSAAVEASSDETDIDRIWADHVADGAGVEDFLESETAACMVDKDREPMECERREDCEPMTGTGDARTARRSDALRRQTLVSF